MSLIAGGLAAAVVVGAGGLSAQQVCDTAQLGTLRPAPNDVFEVPADVDEVFAVNSVSTRVGDTLSRATAGRWTVSTTDASRLAAAQASDGRELVFAANGVERCRRRFSVSELPPEPADSSREVTSGQTITTRTFAPDECHAAGADWQRELADRHNGRFTAIVFLEGAGTGDGDICYYNRDYGVVGDPIYTAVFQRGQVVWRGARFEPCALQRAGPNVLQSGDKFPSALQSGTWQLQTFLERRCYNTSVDVTVHGVRPGAGGNTESVAQRFPLQQYDRYRGTLQLGVLLTPLHERSFGLRRGQPDTTKSFIYDQGPTEDGPEYVATFVLYSLLKYAPSLVAGLLRGHRSDAYPGREVIHDQDFADRLGGVIGVGIRNPTKRFLAGFSFEAIYGVNALAIWEFAQIQRLEGTSVGSEFHGAETTIPTRTEWDHRFTMGMAIDLRYATELFTGGR